MQLTLVLVTRYGQGVRIWDISFSTFNINYGKVRALSFSGISELVKLSNSCFQKAGAVSGTFYGISIMLTKVAILIWFLRFIQSRKLRKCVFATIVVVVLYSLVATFEWLYACRPMAKLWDLTITHGSCVDFDKIYQESSATSAQKSQVRVYRTGDE
jgi:hypothetical protein